MSAATLAVSGCSDRMASASRRGRWLIAATSGHHVQIDQPDVVIAAIRDVIQK